MASSGNKEAVNLNDIVNISEDEFKEQLTNWIEERGVSKALQSKLRADLFEHFNKTNLGRQIALKHQHAHRLILSPLLLVLNTLVAEFLYSEDCHFSLSVFSTEVPFKNTLPDFEGRTKKGAMFRFSENELKDIFEAIKMLNPAYEEQIQDLYFDEEGIANAANTSLLYCIFKNVCSLKGLKGDIKLVDERRDKWNENVTKNEPTEQMPRESAAPDQQCANCDKHKSDKYQIDSRYFKHLNRYLDILSDRVQDMSESLAKIHTKNSKSNKASDSLQLESSVKNSLNKIQADLLNLSKSKKKHRKFQEMINTIEKLSTNVEKCGGNLKNLLDVTSSTLNEIKTQEERIKASKSNTDNDAHDAHKVPKDYGTWLREMRCSENGKKFVARLEVSLQRTLDKEKENLKMAFNEKMENYRTLIKLHYKQKFGAMGKSAEKVDKGDGNKSDVQERRPGQPVQTHRSILKAVLLSSAKDVEHLDKKRIEKEKYVEHIVDSARNRLKQLENESEKLDESFRAYLKRQYSEKNQFNADVSKILQNYNMRKAMLGQHSACKRTLTFDFDKNVTYPVPAVPAVATNKLNYNLSLILNEASDSDVENKFPNPFRNINLFGYNSPNKNVKNVQRTNISKNQKNGISEISNLPNKFDLLAGGPESKEKEIHGTNDRDENSADAQMGHNSKEFANKTIIPPTDHNNNDKNIRKIHETSALTIQIANVDAAKITKMDLNTIDSAKIDRKKSYDEQNLPQFNTYIDKISILETPQLKIPEESLQIRKLPGIEDTLIDNSLQLLMDDVLNNKATIGETRENSINSDAKILFEIKSPDQLAYKLPVTSISSPSLQSDSLSDERQLISTGPARAPSPDDFW